MPRLPTKSYQASPNVSRTMKMTYSSWAVSRPRVRMAHRMPGSSHRKMSPPVVWRTLRVRDWTRVSVS
jgi:hypothetical protein